MHLMFLTAFLAAGAAVPSASAATTTTTTTSATEAGGGAALQPFKGRLLAKDGSGQGVITIDPQNIEVEVHRVFSTESNSFALADVRALHVKKGLFHAWVTMDMRDGDTVRIRTMPKRYLGLKTALKGRITRG